MNDLIENIIKQIEFNKNKNLFFDKLEMFQFTDETIKAISTIDSLALDSKQYLINFTTDKAIEEFSRVNQFFSFDSKTIEELRAIYSDLFDKLQNKTESMENISISHFRNLKRWLKESNPFAEKIYKNVNKRIDPVVCSEYSPKLQINILDISIEKLMQPVLDIGCGSKAKLVNYLIKNGIDAYGIDRSRFQNSVLTTADWLEYKYGEKKWGTVISNLGFSNHFTHHNLREDGNYVEYAKTYMAILNSLKQGGSFHYAPVLPFIEKYLDKNQFNLINNEMTSHGIKTTIVTRIN